MNESNQPGLVPDQKLGQGRYTLIRKLGAGGMGVVWLAHDEHLREEVALKFLPPQVHADKDALDGLRRETARAHKLTHTNIIRIHDFHVPPGETAFISMEYIQGKTLAELRHEQPDGVFSWATLAPLVHQLCEALEYAHGEGVVHRDLKPANLMVDAKGRLKLADFGIAAVVNESQNRITGQVGTSGTVTYMSPQQMNGKTPKPSDDIYALGATLYHLLTSNPPFYQGVITHQVLNTPPTPIPERLKELGIQKAVPPTVCGVVLACLKKEPEQRPANAKAVWKRLEHVTTGTSVGSGLKQKPKSLPSVEIFTEPNEIAKNPVPASRRSWPIFLLVIAVLVLAGWGLSKLFEETIPAQQAQDASRVEKGEVTKQITPATPNQSQPLTNSLGMVFVPVPGTKVLFCIWETRVQDYQAYARANPGANMEWQKPGFSQDATHPVVNVNWDDALSFCRWLTEQERPKGQITGNQSYRLPTDQEWSAAVGLPNEGTATPSDMSGKFKDVYPWGNQWPPPKGAGNYDPTLNVDSFRNTAPVGSFSANKNALFDLGGNVWEWCENWYDSGQTARVLRGGSWNDFGLSLHSSIRSRHTPESRYGGLGFRVVVGAPVQANNNASKVVSATVPQKSVPNPTQEIKSPPLSKVAEITQAHPWTNSLGQPFVPVPGTKVLFCIWETRVQDFEAFVKDQANNSGYEYRKGWDPKIMKSDGVKKRGWEYGWNNPGFTQGPTHPVTCVSWEDAKAFCQWLTVKEQRARNLAVGHEYRLPTDVEWSHAVGIGDLEGNGNHKEKNDRKLENVYPWGTQWPPPNGAGNYAGNEAKDADWPSDDKLQGIIAGYRDGFARTAPVGSFKPNQNGLYDLSGNVWEFCEDWYAAEQKYRMLRGGCWNNGNNNELISSCRNRFYPMDRSMERGFRVVVGSSKP